MSTTADPLMTNPWVSSSSLSIHHARDCRFRNASMRNSNHAHTSAQRELRLAAFGWDKSFAAAETHAANRSHSPPMTSQPLGISMILFTSSHKLLMARDYKSWDVRRLRAHRTPRVILPQEVHP